MMGVSVRVTELGRERRCSKCGEYWPEDSEFYFFRKYRGGVRVNQPCKACYRELPSWQARKAKQKGVLSDEVIARCHRLFLSGVPRSPAAL